MKKLFILLAAAMILTFISCERNDEQSPIKGVWKCQLNGGEMTLEYGEHSVKYTSYAEFFNATAIYEGTYTIKGNEIIHEFTSLKTKNSSKITYYSPEEMPKEAILKDNNTIVYLDYSFTRE